jgi:hypothetical protein
LIGIWFFRLRIGQVVTTVSTKKSEMAVYSLQHLHWSHTIGSNRRPITFDICLAIDTEKVELQFRMIRASKCEFSVVDRIQKGVIIHSFGEYGWKRWFSIWICRLEMISR